MTEEEVNKISDITAMYDGIYLNALDINAAGGAGAIFIPDFFMNPDGEAWFKHVLYENRFKAKFKYLKLLNKADLVVLDTETTGLEADDEVVELGIIDMRGNVLYNSRFKNSKPLHWAAAKVTKIRKNDLQNEPLFKNEWSKIQRILTGKRIIIFNEGFDCRLIAQTLERYGLDKSEADRLFFNQIDAMQVYLSYFPQKSNKISLEKCCQKLSIFKKEEHGAIEDCKLTLLMLHHLDNRLEGEDVKLLEDKTDKKYSYSSKNNRVSELKALIENGIYDINILAKKIGCSPFIVEKIIFNDFTTNDIDFSKFIQPGCAELIKNTISNMADWDGRLKPIKDLLPDDVSYTSIRAVIRHFDLKIKK